MDFLQRTYAKVFPKLSFTSFHGHYFKQQDGFQLYTPHRLNIQVKNEAFLDYINLVGKERLVTQANSTTEPDLSY